MKESFISKALSTGLNEPDIRGKPDRWEIIRPLGRGTTGVIFLVRERRVKNAPLRVLKIPLTPSQNERIKTEIRALQMVDHPNIVSLIDSDPEAEVPWLVEEHVPGKPLLDTDLTTWTDRQLQELYHTVYKTVIQYLHRRGLLIGDLAPSNIMLKNRKPMLIDLEHCQISDRSEFDRRNDLFQLGTLYHYLFYRKGGGEN